MVWRFRYEFSILIKPNTEIALEWEWLSSHFSFADVNADLTVVANNRFTGSANGKTQFATVNQLH